MAAIYQWFEGLIEVQIWTTTLYPLETADAIKFDISISSSSLDQIDNDSIEQNLQLISISKYPALLEAPEQEGLIEQNLHLISISKYVALLQAPEQEGSIEQNLQLVAIEKVKKLITIHSPDHGLLFDTYLDSSNCSLDAI